MWASRIKKKRIIIISQNTNTKRICQAKCVCVWWCVFYKHTAFHPALIMINYRLMSFIFYTVELKSLIKLKPKISLRWSRSLSVLSMLCLLVRYQYVSTKDDTHTHTHCTHSHIHTAHTHFVARSSSIEKEKMNWLLRAFTKRKLSK